MTAESPLPEIAEMIVATGGRQLLSCMQCGTCTALCPWPQVSRMSPRLVLRLASLGIEGWERDDIWRCVSCRTCVSKCPRGIDVPEVMRSARVVVQESGGAPRAHRGPLASLRSSGSPWSGERSERAAFFRTLGLGPADASCDAQYLPCCTQIYDARSRRTARALAAVLDLAGVRLGAPDERVGCCGEQARAVGADEVFAELARENESGLAASPGTPVLVTSPHCLEILQKGTRTAAGQSLRHHTQWLGRLLQEGRLTPSNAVPLRVTYHDPCYLGRHLGEYEAPRKVLRSIPGLDLVEMPRHGENSWCCGGGGGGLWLDLPQPERFALSRVQEALATGASVIATACPFCTLMLEDAVKVLELESQLAVRDVAELLADSLEGLGPAPLGIDAGADGEAGS